LEDSLQYLLVDDLLHSMYDFSKYIGIPYKNLGRDFGGCDCYGLLYLIYYKELGIELPDYTELQYSKSWYKKENHILDNIDSKWIRVDDYNYSVFDALIFFGIGLTTIANHIGMYIENGKFIHIFEGHTSMINKLEKFNNKLYGAMRYIG